MKNINSTLTKAQSISLPSITSTSKGNSKFSFGIVNSKTNGKRLSFSKALAEKIDLDKCAYLTPICEDGKVLVAGTKVFDSYECSLRGDDKKLSYNSGVVETLTELFSLDFSKHVSISFSKIDFEEYEGVNIAIITLSPPVSTENTEDDVEEADAV